MKKENIFITGYAKLPSGITAAELYTVIAVGLVVNRDTGVIKEADCTLATQTGKNFVRELIVGKQIDNLQELLDDISDNYLGSAKKAILSALKQCNEKYKMYLEGKNDYE